MESKIYTVRRIEGEYAYISEEGSSEELFIALALLPFGVDVGDRVIYDGVEMTLG
jgi:hypothetical protein